MIATYVPSRNGKRKQVRCPLILSGCKQLLRTRRLSTLKLFPHSMPSTALRFRRIRHCWLPRRLPTLTCRRRYMGGREGGREGYPNGQRKQMPRQSLLSPLHLLSLFPFPPSPLPPPPPPSPLPHIQYDDLQLRLSRNRNQSVLEINQGLQEATEKFEKEKLTLMEQNKRLRAELDKINSEKEVLVSSRQDQEAELRELRQNKELLTQWERQIADIIQWVTEEKDAR